MVVVNSPAQVNQYHGVNVRSVSQLVAMLVVGLGNINAVINIVALMWRKEVPTGADRLMRAPLNQGFYQ